jgi:hypothetical protein
MPVGCLPHMPRPCPCCGGRMLITETFARGCEPKHRPTRAAAAIRIEHTDARGAGVPAGLRDVASRSRTRKPGGAAGAREAVVTDTIDELTRKALSCMLRGAAGGKPMSIDAEEAAIRTVIVGALMGHSEAGERGFDALFAMRQAEAIVKALKIGGYEIKRVSR